MKLNNKTVLIAFVLLSLLLSLKHFVFSDRVVKVRNTSMEGREIMPKPGERFVIHNYPDSEIAHIECSYSWDNGQIIIPEEIDVSETSQDHLTVVEVQRHIPEIFTRMFNGGSRIYLEVKDTDGNKYLFFNNRSSDIKNDSNHPDYWDECLWKT